jgi:dipeptidyl-peptidase-4
MLKLRAINLLLVFTFCFSYSFSQNKLTIEDIWGKYQFYGNSVEGFNSMKDGEHYSAIDEDKKGNSNFLVYSYQSGKATDTMVLGNI